MNTKKTVNQLVKEYRARKKRVGWKCFSVLAPPECVEEMKQVFQRWKIDHYEQWIETPE